MSENQFEYRASLDTRQMIDDIAKRIQEDVDQAALDRAAATLAKFGYEKVVRCRDCVGFEETIDGYECQRFSGEYRMAVPNGFCNFAERREQ